VGDEAKTGAMTAPRRRGHSATTSPLKRPARMVVVVAAVGEALVGGEKLMQVEAPALVTRQRR